MSITLSILRDQYVFESTPQYQNLGALHVPFDDLDGTERTETRLRGALERNEPTAIVGHSGAGKSSLMAHVLNPLAEGVAPLVIPLASMPANVVSGPSKLVDHLLATVARQAAATDLSEAVATKTETVTTTRKGGLGAGWGWFKGELAREVKRQTEIEHSASFADKTAVFMQVLNIMNNDGLRPVLVFDDTDRWLRNESTTLVQQFFGEDLRWLLELGHGVVVAVHPTYFDIAPQAELLQYLDTQIALPHIAEPTGIARIITRRIELYAEIANPELGDALANDAIEAIHSIYTETGSLRRAIHVCHTAVHEALDAGDTLLTARHITTAAGAG